MAFTPKTWVDRAVEFAGRRLLIAVNGLANGFDVSRSEGTVFVPGDEIDATNLNDLETRISDEFALINSAISGLDETIILWTNPNPNTSFIAQSITLSETIANFSYYEVIYKPSYIVNSADSTGRIPVSFLHALTNVYDYIARRSITALSGTSMSFATGYRLSAYNSTATEDTAMCVPYKVIGYK